MPQRSDADFLQVRVGERRCESEVDVVVGERLGVLPEIEPLQPIGDAHCATPVPGGGTASRRPFPRREPIAESQRATACYRMTAMGRFRSHTARQPSVRFYPRNRTILTV